LSLWFRLNKISASGTEIVLWVLTRVFMYNSLLIFKELISDEFEKNI